MRIFKFLHRGFGLKFAGHWLRSLTMKKRTTITIETRQVQIIRRHMKTVQARCHECSASVPMLTPEEAAVLAQITSRTIRLLVEAGELHFTETPEGVPLICLNSLIAPQLQGHLKEKKS